MHFSIEFQHTFVSLTWLQRVSGLRKAVLCPGPPYRLSSRAPQRQTARGGSRTFGKG